jgi:hypothetical protein
MIVRRYGSTVQGVKIDFNSKALTEIGFRRDRKWSIPDTEFEETYEKTATRELTAEAEGDVQDHVEQVMLDDLEGQLEAILDELPEGGVVLVESAQGVDYPKTRCRTKNVVVEGENRLYFYSSIDPLLRVALYRPL